MTGRFARNLSSESFKVLRFSVMEVVAWITGTRDSGGCIKVMKKREEGGGGGERKRKEGK